MTFSRRSLVKGAGWAAPVIATTALVPTYAASRKSTEPSSSDAPVLVDNTSRCSTGKWRTGALIRMTDADYSNVNYLNKVNYDATPSGEAMLQHWFDSRTGKAHWRLHLGFPDGAEAGATITFEKHGSWANPGAISQSGLQTFKKLDAKKPELYSTDIPSGVAFRTDTGFGLSFPNGIPAGAAGVVQFSADPTVSAQEVLAGAVLEAWATVEFAPKTCA